MMRTLTFALLVAAAACGGKDKAAPAMSTTTSGPHGSAPGADHHAGMPAEMTRFHDVLRPRWHADAGPQRTTDTCAAVPQFKAEADAIAQATPPREAHADTWTTATRALVAAVDELATACAANDSSTFEGAFRKVHDAFHALMAAAGMQHGHGHEHGGHGHGHEHGGHGHGHAK
jgi:hypothetical protein